MQQQYQLQYHIHQPRPPTGVVHANVGQKLVFCYLRRVFYEFFLLTDLVVVTQHLSDVTNFSN